MDIIAHARQSILQFFVICSISKHTIYKGTKGLIHMSDILSKYTVIREYKNEYSIDEFLKHIIRIHIGTVRLDITNIKECSDHEVHENENK